MRIGIIPSIHKVIHQPTHSASIAFFRMVLGTILAIEGIAEWAIGHVDRVYIEPEFHFTYPFFEWVKPLPGIGMHIIQGLTVAGAIGFALGWRFRLSGTILFFAYTYKFLIDSAWYLNHHYLIILLLFLFTISPAGKYWSLDVRRNQTEKQTYQPGIWRFVLLYMITVVYFYAGIAKINEDWLRCEPMLSWLAEGEGAFVSGSFLKATWVAAFLSYGGLVFDLCIPWFLMFRKTRPYAFGVVLFFHLTNFILFEIGVFPWTMLAATSLYFAPDWPLTIWNRIKKRSTDPEISAVKSSGRGTVVFLTSFLVVQTLIPFRHFLYPGNVSWTEEGHRFSWHMLLRSKSGSVYFELENLTTHQLKKVSPAARLDKWQYRKLAVHPEMIVQYAQFLGQEQLDLGWDSVSVKAQGLVSLNGRTPGALVDPNYNLMGEKLGFGRYEWLLPLPSIQKEMKN